MSQCDYDELVASMRACREVGYEGWVKFYDQLLQEHWKNGTLPLGEELRLMQLDEGPQQRDEE